MNNRFHGIIPYLVSPINQNNGEIKVEVLNELVEDLIKEGVHGLSPLGSTGEVHYLTIKQKNEIVRNTVNITNGRVPVIPGVSAYSTNEALEQINTFEKIGVDGIVLILNTYFKLTEKDILSFFKTVARSVSCPIVLYNNPKYNGVDLTPELVIELSSESNIQYFKDATGNTGRLLSIINKAGNNINIFSASAHIPSVVMNMGGVGWMSGPSCIFPKLSVQLYDFIQSNNISKSREIQKQLWEINEFFQQYTLSAVIKAGLEIKGYQVGDPIHPLKSLDKKERKKLKEVIDKLS